MTRNQSCWAAPEGYQVDKKADINLPRILYKDETKKSNICRDEHVIQKLFNMDMLLFLEESQN
jgi:hypothetical protein